MSDILFVTWDGGGNVPPATAVARELRDRGHTIRFLGHAGQSRTLQQAGFEVVPTRYARRFSSLEHNSLLDIMAAFGDRGMGQDLLAAVSARPADLVVVDCLMFGALDTARRAGLPYAVLEHLYDSYYERGCLRGPLSLGMRLRRLAPRRAVDAAAARIVTTLPELDPTSAPGVRQVGPVVDVAPRVEAEPMVLVSLSTFGFPGMQRTLQTIIDATGTLDARVVVTTGHAVDPAALRRHDRAEVHRFVPHVELMPGASILVGHGGHGTTMQGLAHDLPVVVLPMDTKTDQPVVGRSLVEAGAGRVVSRKTRPQDLTPVLAQMLGDGPHREAAARLGEAVRARSGAIGGADVVEELVGAPTPHSR